jgi:hypothetical protein
MTNFTAETTAAIDAMDRRTTAELYRIKALAAALLAKIDNITTDDFSKGGEAPEREALRAALAKFDA